MSPEPAKQRKLADQSFSKGQVNRAGRVLLDAAEAASRVGADRAARELDAEEIVLAFRAVK